MGRQAGLVLVALGLLLVAMPLVRADAAKNEEAEALPTDPAVLKTWSIKKLREALAARGVECRGCSEKAHLVDKVIESAALPLKPKVDPPRTNPKPDVSDKELQDILRKMRAQQTGDRSYMTEEERKKQDTLEELKRKLKESGIPDLNVYDASQLREELEKEKKTAQM